MSAIFASRVRVPGIGWNWLTLIVLGGSRKETGRLFSQAGSGSWNGTGLNISSSDEIISQPPSLEQGIGTE